MTPLADQDINVESQVLSGWAGIPSRPFALGWAPASGPWRCATRPEDYAFAKSWRGGSRRLNYFYWAEALLKIAGISLTNKPDGNWTSFQLANSALPLSVTSSAIAPSARMRHSRPDLKPEG